MEPSLWFPMLQRWDLTSTPGLRLGPLGGLHSAGGGLRWTHRRTRRELSREGWTLKIQAWRREFGFILDRYTMIYRYTATNYRWFCKATYLNWGFVWDEICNDKWFVKQFIPVLGGTTGTPSNRFSPIREGPMMWKVDKQNNQSWIWVAFWNLNIYIYIYIPNWNLRFSGIWGQGWNIQINLTIFEYQIVGWKHMITSKNVLFTCPITSFGGWNHPFQSWKTPGS